MHVPILFTHYISLISAIQLMFIGSCIHQDYYTPVKIARKHINNKEE